MIFYMLRKNLMVTAGASHGLFLIASLFFKTGDTVFVEDPTYFIAFQTLVKDLQLNVIPVEVDSEGININKLEKLLEEINIHKKDAEFNAMIYVIPAFQNPCGFSYSQQRSIDLVKLAEKHNLLIVCDDVYNLLSYHGKAVTPLFYYQKCLPKKLGNVISNCSFSKILGPGLRLGWIQASEDMLEVFKNSGVLKSGGCFNHYTSGITASAIELGLLDEFMPKLLEDYGNRCSTVCKILKGKLPVDCNFLEPKGGYFVWIVLPSHVNADALVSYAKNNFNVSVLPGNYCSVANNFKNCIRVAFTFHEEQQVYESVDRLCEAINLYLKQ